MTVALLGTPDIAFPVTTIAGSRTVAITALLQAFGDLVGGRNYLWSGVVLAVFLFLLASVYAIGPRLKDRMDDGTAEAIQSSLTTAAGILAGGLLVEIWEVNVRESIQAVQVGPDTGVKVLVVLVALGVSYTLTRVTKRLVRIGEGRDAITVHQREVLHHVVQILVFVPAILFSLRLLFEVPPGDLVVGAGAVSLIVGLAARQTLASVLAGFVLLFSRPFEVGDWVVIDDHEGIVTDVTIFNTRLRTFDEEHVVIPNDQITDSAVTNRSKNKYLRVRVNVGVDYDADVKRAAEVAVAAMEGAENVIDRRSPEVVVEEFGDSAVVLELRFWIDHPTIHRKWDAQNAVIEAVKSAFEEADISIPFPQRVLTGREQAGGLHVRGDAVDARGDGADGDGREVDDRATGGADGDSTDGADSDSTDGADGTGTDADQAVHDDDTAEPSTERDDD